MPTINQETRAAVVWRLLVRQASIRQPITYGALGGAADIHHRALREPLNLIQRHCQENALPPLSVLVVYSDTGEPGPGFGALPDGLDLSGAQEAVFDHFWDEVPNPFAHAPTRKNPPWTRDELILALELYFREPAARGNRKHPEVKRLSQLLNQLPIHRGAETGIRFRNASGVGMKLANFLRFDTTYHGKGLKSGGQLEKAIWDEFAKDQAKLRQAANAIIRNGFLLDAFPEADEEELSEFEASEGRILTRIHRYRERDQGIVKKKKETVIKTTGALICEVCGFDFNKKYGQLGEGFAECHHEKPVSELSPSDKTRLSDLRIVCANCHRMIHRAKPWLTVSNLKGQIRR